MTVRIEKGVAKGRVNAPPSKSMAHRYLICGAMSSGSEIKNIELSKDIEATLRCLYALGADITLEDNTVKIGKNDFKKGIRNKLLNCFESGSTLRFLLPLCLLFDEEITLTGSERLFKRSLTVYEEICKSQNIFYKQTENSVTVKGRLKCGKYSVRGDISSQFISGLMFALSQLEGDSEIDITGKIESGSYLGLTVKALADFGVRISRTDEHTIYIKGNQTCKKRSLKVEGDYSNAAFFDAFNLLGGNVMVRRLNEESAQGDRVYRDIFARISKENTTVDISDCPDLGPVIMAVAATQKGATLTGTARLRIKESDRGEAMKSELAKLGIRVDVEENSITVHKGELTAPKGPILSHNDHRIVMSMAVLLTLTGGEILGAEAVAKSFPDFFEWLCSVGIKVEKVNEIN